MQINTIIKAILKKIFPQRFCEHEYGEVHIQAGTFCDPHTRYCSKCRKEYRSNW